MTQDEAKQAVAYLNAAFPRDVLEPESAAIWVREIVELRNPVAAHAAAQTIGRNGDRFPTLKEFRAAYRQAADALRPPELETPVAPPPPEAVEMLERIRSDAVLRSIDDLPPTNVMPPRPVWQRHLRRKWAGDNAMPLAGSPTDAEKHDAILVLGENGNTYADELMQGEALRIVEESCT